MSTVTPISPAAAAPSPARRRMRRPGTVECALVVFTVFVTAYSLPNYWFTSAEPGFSAEPESGTLLLLSLIGLSAVGFARVVGELNHLIAVVRSDTTPFLFAGLACLSVLWSDSPSGTLYYGMILVAMVVYASYLMIRFTLAEILTLTGYAVMLGTVANFVFVLALGSYGRASVGDELLWDGVYGNKNNLGFYSGVALLIVLVVARAPGRVALAWYATAAANAVLLYGSGSRTMGGAGLASVMLLVAYHAFRARHTLRGGVILSLTTVVTVMIAYITANLGSLVERVGKDPSLTGRTKIWSELLPIIEERLVAGWGYAAAFRGYGSPIHELWVNNDWEPDHAHNAVLGTAADLGLIGAGLLCFMLLRGLWRGVKATEHTRGSVALYPLVFVSFVILVSVTETGVHPTSFGWLLLCVSLFTVGRAAAALRPPR